MPTYEYTCPSCGKETSITISFTEHTKNPPCPFCKGVLQWKPTTTSFVLKGNGWPGKGDHGKES